MKPILKWTTLAAVAVLAMSTAAMGGSIWAKAASRCVPHADDTARKIGDILKVVIEERTTIDSESKREMSKDRTDSATASGELTLPYLMSLLRPEHNINSPVTDLNMALAFKREADSEDKVEKTRELTDDITVTVADVLPNGNLVVVGSRERRAAGDNHTVHVSGIVRPSDITFANSVSSKSVAEFKITFKSSGVGKNFTQLSIFDKVLTWFNLF